MLAVNKTTGEVLTVKEWYESKNPRLGKVVFEDGTTLTEQEIDLMAQTYHGSQGDEPIKGGDIVDDNIFGNGGNDNIYGYKGDDTLDGGAGNDWLEGGYGDDVYVWGAGYGNDTIKNTDVVNNPSLRGGLLTAYVNNGTAYNLTSE